MFLKQNIFTFWHFNQMIVFAWEIPFDNHLFFIFIEKLIHMQIYFGVKIRNF